MPRPGRATTTTPSVELELSALPREVDAVLLRHFRDYLDGQGRRDVESPQTVHAYTFGAGRFARWLAAHDLPDLDAVQREHVVRYVDGLRAHRAPATVHLNLAAVRVFYQWRIEEGDRTDDPTVRINRPRDDRRLREPFSHAEVTAIMGSQKPATFVGARNLALFAVLLDTGLRRAEVLGMTALDLSQRHGEIRVIGKGAKERKVRLDPATMRYLNRYELRRAKAGWNVPELWLTNRGTRLSEVDVSDLFIQLSKRLGFHVHAHRFRHTFAQWALDNGMDRESVRALMGHESDAILRRYTRATDLNRAMEAHKRASPMASFLRKR